VKRQPKQDERPAVHGFCWMSLVRGSGLLACDRCWNIAFKERERP